MKNTILTTLLLLALTSSISSNAQVGIGVTTANMAASAQLDVSSTTKGFLPPRMTYAQRNAIVTPGAGLIIYCTDCGSNGGEPEFYNGTAWVSMYGLQGSLPTLAPTTSITAIDIVSATSGGNILTDGGVTVFIRGLCWSTSSNPTIALSTKTVDGSGTGAFTSAITGLTNTTTYYVRAYATNAAGTAYGNEVVFTTLPPGVPTISTFNISSDFPSLGICGGNISSDGYATVTARGVCWSSSSNPTIALSTKTVDGTGIGSFISSITGLTDNTTYYFRAYATNAIGTAYGNEVVYTVIRGTIGTQVWSTQNLNVSTYSDGTPIPEVTNPTAWGNLTTGAWCYYNNLIANGTTYGKLYNGYAVAGIYDASSLSTPSLRKNLAPAGYHIPTDAEWTTLTDYLEGLQQQVLSGAGGKLKEIGISHWLTPNRGATDTFGFAGLPGGMRKYDGLFFGMGFGLGLWSSTENPPSPQNPETANWYRYMDHTRSSLDISSENWGHGHSVRCIKN
jgi:uncharacterized protein (TIGR02145 family)